MGMDPPIAVGDFVFDAYGNLGFNFRDISDRITRASISWSMDGVSQLSFSVWDPDYSMLNNNYFQLRRAVIYDRFAATIATTRISQANGRGVFVECEARDITVQAMKLNKNPASISAGSATEYAQIAAAQVNLSFQGEYSPVVPTITSTTGTSDESVWSVLQSLASEARFVCFVVSDGTMYFASEQWLLRKYGMQMFFGNGVVFWWPDHPPDAIDPLRLVEAPICYTSDDDPYAAEFTARVDRTNATQLRPGMTAYLAGTGVAGFRGQYLITEVEYEWRSPTPVTVTCRTPERPRDKDNNLVPEFRNAFE